MSAYGKPSQQQPPDYDTRPSQAQHLPNPSQSSYAAYSPHSHFTTPPQAPHVAHVHRQPAQPAPTLSGPYQSRTFEEQSSSLVDPTIVSYQPSQGSQGTQFFIYLHSVTNLTTDPRVFRFMFGSRRCNTTLHKDANKPGIYYLTGEVPAFNLTGWVVPQITVYLNMEDQQRQELGTIEVGHFNYTDVSPHPSYTSPPRQSRKRKSTAEPDENLKNSAKRPASQPIRPKSEDYGSYGYQSQNPASFQPYTPTSGTERSYGIYSGYDTEHSSTPGYPPQTSPRNFSYTYPGPAEGPQSAVGPQPGHSWSGYPVHQSGPQSVPATTVRTAPIESSQDPPPSLPSPSDAPNPTLIRTSTLQQAHSGPVSGQGATGGSGTGFNPYGIYPHKAVLEIQGELNGMATQWSAEEWESRRRLVQFWRQQKGSTIHTTFRPVAPNDRQPNSICISCIWWAEKSECYVTSVDCIYLLESLIAVRFTVEEKNRIRRNLEGFKPLTVSKAKPDSENFFKLIMAFPNPKPRNIEKDVKVFPWQILPHALRKIIGKYSASYSSTASVIPSAPGSTYPGAPPGETSQGGSTESVPPAHTPPSASDSTSAGPSKVITGTAGPPPIKPPPPSATPPITRPVGSTDIQSHIPARPPLPASHSMWTQQPQSQHISAQGSRSSWDNMPAYLENSPATSAPAGGQALHYQRAAVTGEDRESVSVAGQTGTQLSSDVNAS
ncbi:hypothetical protein RUND412_001714 [Rhizina undulata]